jgi:3-hydroxyisobutyrate dehydrogenase-like beta-hydroxyacid dehydrogenase
MNDVTVLGLGSMGITLARLFLKKGRRVTVWNRSAEKALGLATQNALQTPHVAPDVAAAVRASSLVVMCVYDYAAADAIWRSPGVAEAVAGRTVVQLTTGSPKEARDAAAWAARHGAHYLDGAIQAAPSQMGQADTPVLLSGPQAAWQDAKAVLEDIAGDIVYLGPQIDAAASMDLATLSYVYGAFTGFIHGARLVETNGLDVAQFGRIVQKISPSFGAFFAHEGAVIQSGDFRITESPLRISVEATARILQASRDAGLATQIPALSADLLQRADQAGLGGEELAALIKLLRA